MSQDFDVIIIGAGHNGLTCAAYLAMAGLRVGVFERRAVVGGAAVTEEFHPGFRNSVAAYTVSLLNPKVIRDLDLHGHGLEIVERRASNFWPQPDGRYLLLRPGLEAQQAEIAKFSARDAERLPAYHAAIERAADLLRDLVLETPPNAGGGLLEVIRAGRIGNRLRRLSIEEQRLLLDLFTKSVADFLDLWFESEVVKGAFGFDGIVGFYGSPTTPGTAYVLMHHCFGEVNGKRGVWGHAVGGMGAITQAMARAAAAKGVTISVEAPVREVLVEKGRAAGIVLEDGRQIRARAVASNLSPKLLFLALLDPAHLPADFRERIERYRCGSGVLRMNVALSALPDFACRPGSGLQDHHGAGIVIGPTLDYLDRAYRDAVATGWSRAPIVEMLIASALDETLAPEGQHVASLFCQQFAPKLPDGRSWDEAREAAADQVIETVDRFAPNFKASVIARQVLTPLDLEREFGLVDGDIFHGMLSPDQMFSARPVLGHGNYRAPIRDLYLCGAGSHPGGGVTGAPGHNAAREIIRDLKGGIFTRRWLGA